ncbi:CPBP family intramembrane glutamic endopeptidase [Winogradskyella tangerina]|uniref:CPBP family intramembrane glutamic endopeptidase n=1 Tax=Winogradskyella tangerina TaxID=2023240 RepID=UPI000DBE8191|nr:type II CAAX endopeptidase family protein [Winogradskyella tangerina]
MKTKFIKLSSALLLPISFILILILLSVLPFSSVSKYGFGGVLITVIALIVSFFALRIDGKSLKEGGFSMNARTPLKFAYGFLIGSVIALVMIGIILNFSSLGISLNEDLDLSSLPLWFAGIFILAFMEEVIFRGYAFAKIYKNYGIWPAQILLALLFAWYHDFSGASFFVQLLGPGVWAFVFGLAAIYSKGIALPTGLHMALNVVLALVGLKENREGVWNLEYAIEPTSEMIQQTETIGMLLQVLILVIALLLTEKLRRKKQKHNNNIF